jgi:hypothetical protein
LTPDRPMIRSPIVAWPQATSASATSSESGSDANAARKSRSLPGDHPRRGWAPRGGRTTRRARTAATRISVSALEETPRPARVGPLRLVTDFSILGGPSQDPLASLSLHSQYVGI